MPRIRVSRSKLAKLLNISDDELKKYRSAFRGEYNVVLMDSLLADIVHDLSIIRRKLGLSQIDLTDKGTRIVSLINSLLSGTLGHGRVAKKEKELIAELCSYLSVITSGDFTALQEFWALDYTPRQIAQAVQSRAHKLGMEPTEELLLTIENLKWVGESPREHIPECR